LIAALLLFPKNAVQDELIFLDKYGCLYFRLVYHFYHFYHHLQMPLHLVSLHLFLLCLFYILVNVTTYGNARKRILSRRLGWTVKVHGNWCGPGWTGGRYVSSKEYFRLGLENVACTDAVDCACKLHDKECAHESGCSKEADSAFIEMMNNFIEDAPIDESWYLLAKAKLMRDSIIIAQKFRKHRQLRARRLRWFDNFPSFSGGLVQKVHGNWCGPGWIGGKYLDGYDYVKMGGDFSEVCVDDLDCACKIHDEVCATNPLGCSRDSDRTFITQMDKYLQDNHCSTSSKSLCEKAKYMKFWISMAMWKRKYL